MLRRTLLVTVFLGMTLASCAETTGLRSNLALQCDPSNACWPKDYVNQHVDYSSPNFTTIHSVRALLVDNPHELCSRFVSTNLHIYACHLNLEGGGHILVLPKEDYVSPSGRWTFDILLKHELGHVLGVTVD